MRRWQKAITIIKKQTAQKNKFIENLAIAINYHEQSLVTKGFLSFIKHKVSHAR
jgi:hypothetical protein